MNEQPKPAPAVQPHVVSLSNRTALTVTGVQEVDRFDDTAVVALTVQGELTVTGEGLHLVRLNTETGELSVEGTVHSLVYAAPRARGGWLGKLFR